MALIRLLPSALPSASDMTAKTDERITIELKHPITIAGADVSVVKMREPKAGDFRRAFTKNAAEKLSSQQIMMNMAADLCGISSEEFDELSLVDMTTIISKVEDFA